MPSADHVFQSVVQAIESLSGDWAITHPLTPETQLIGDLAIKSLDLVVLASSMVKKYGPIPFDRLYARMEDAPPKERDLTIAEFVEFVRRNAPRRTPATNAQG